MCQLVHHVIMIKIVHPLVISAVKNSSNILRMQITNGFAIIPQIIKLVRKLLDHKLQPLAAQLLFGLFLAHVSASSV